MTYISAKELREKDKANLFVILKDHKKELAQLRAHQHIGATVDKLGKIRIIRKNIARILTVLNQKESQNLRAFYKGQKWIPKKLRPKLTKSRRLALTPREASIRTRKQIRKASKFPLRTFAVKV